MNDDVIASMAELLGRVRDWKIRRKYGHEYVDHELGKDLDDYLVACLHEKSVIREMAIRRIAKCLSISMRSEIASVIKVLLNDPDDDVLWSAVLAARKHGTVSAVQLLLMLSISPNKKISDWTKKFARITARDIAYG